MNPVAFKKTITGCARCDGEGHADLEWYEFTRPVKVEGWKYTHWAMCPTVNEPILMWHAPVPEPSPSHTMTANLERYLDPTPEGGSEPPA